MSSTKRRGIDPPQEQRPNKRLPKLPPADCLHSADAEMANNNTGDGSGDEIFQDAEEDLSGFGTDSLQSSMNQPSYDYDNVHGDLAGEFAVDFTAGNARGITAILGNDEWGGNGQQQENVMDTNCHTRADTTEEYSRIESVQRTHDYGYTPEEEGDGEAEESIFNKTFGMQEKQEDDSDIEEVSPGELGQKLESKATSLVYGGEKKRRLSTPEPPTGIRSKEAREALKDAASSAKVQRSNNEEKRERPGPDISRDCSRSLRAQWRFHDRVAHLIPRLPNQEFFDWERRYWIAVLIEGKKAHSRNLVEKDFVWMKGNKFSTVATVFHSYANAIMVDKDDLVLLLGNESVEMVDQMQELDLFSDRLVVLRAKLKSDPDSKSRSLVEGIEPVEIDLTDD